MNSPGGTRLLVFKPHSLMGERIPVLIEILGFFAQSLPFGHQRRAVKNEFCSRINKDEFLRNYPLDKVITIGRIGGR